MGSYGNNITISLPGENWQMLWPYDFSNVQLDIVGFLAILGEQSMLANAQVSALSRLFYLPRLLPAPQALLKVSRPNTLTPVTATVTSVLSGNKINHIHHVASILLETAPNDLKTYSVRCVRITKSKDHENPRPPTLFDRVFRGLSKQKKGVDETKENAVKAKAAGPLTWVTLLGVILTLTIIVTSFCLGDGMSLMAAISLSLLSTVVGIANKWELELPRLPKDSPNKIDKDAVVIRYPNGSFLVIKSNEHIRRELFFAPEEINYTVKSAVLYRTLALVGSVLLMFGVILLANARLELQLAWAGIYILLNVVHWGCAALPARLHWDLSYYHVEEESVDARNDAMIDGEPTVQPGPESENFTTALWKVILLTKESGWVRTGEGAPNTPVWDKWLELAGNAARRAPKAGDGKLIKPVHAWKPPREGKIYYAPKDFDPKGEYDRLAREDKERREAELAKEEKARKEQVHASDLSTKQAVAGATAVPPYTAKENGEIV